MKKFILLGITLISVQPGAAQERKLPIDTVVTPQHNVTINGTAISYTAKTETQPVWDELGQLPILMPNTACG